MLRGIGAAATIATSTVAGCIDQLSNPGNQSGGATEWPPGNGQINFIQNSGPGSRNATFQRVAANVLSEYLPDADEIDIQNDSAQGGGGLVAANTLAGESTDGSAIGLHVYAALLNNAIMFPEQAEYTPTDFNYIGQVNAYTRVFATNPETTDFDDHWQMSYDDFVDQHADLRYGLLGEGHGSTLFLRLLAEFDPNLDIGAMEQNFLHYDGGGEARAAIQQGEVDVNIGGYDRTRQVDQEILKSQFVATSPTYQSHYEKAMNIDGNTKSLYDTNFSEDEADSIIEILLNRVILYAPPGLSSEIRTIYTDAYEQAIEDDALYPAAEEAGLNPDTDVVPLSGGDLASAVESGWQVRQDNQDLLQQLSG